MFSKSNTNMAHSGEKSSGAVNAVGQGSTITGEIITNGDLRIDGTLKGNVHTKSIFEIENEERRIVFSLTVRKQRCPSERYGPFGSPSVVEKKSKGCTLGC